METAKPSGPRACRPCAVSKARCLFPEDITMTNGKCRRCNRLNKDCVKPMPMGQTLKSRKTTRVSRLEEKLDGLVSMMSAAPQSILNPHIALPSDFESLKLSQASSRSTPSSFQYPSTNGISSLKDKLRDDPDVLLNLYHRMFEENFPFIIIPGNTTFYDFEQQKPFLSTVVLMVASIQDPRGLSMLAEDIIYHISARTILQPDRNLDLLEGLLLFLAWNHLHLRLHRAPRTAVLLHLAMSLVIDLDLNHEPAEINNHNTPQGMFKVFTRAQPTPNLRTLEERRAYLGLIYLASVISVYLKPMDGTIITTYAVSCAQLLEDTAEYPSDQYLVHLLRLQILVQEIRQTLPREGLETYTNHAPISMCIRTLQTKLESFKNNLPMPLQQNPVLLMHYYSVLLYLTETAFFLPVTTRTATLQACLFATHSFLTTLFSLPTIAYAKLTYVTWIQLIYALGVLSKLSQLDSEDWDASHVRGVIDLSLVVDALIARFETLEEMQDGPNMLLKVAVVRLRKFKDDFEVKRMEIVERRMLPVEIAYEPVENMGAMPPLDPGWGQLEEAFWQEIMTEWNPTFT